MHYVWRGAEEKMTVPSYENRIKDIAIEKLDHDPGVQRISLSVLRGIRTAQSQ